MIKKNCKLATKTFRENYEGFYPLKFKTSGWTLKIVFLPSPDPGFARVGGSGFFFILVKVSPRALPLFETQTPEALQNALS